jgi:hypothetical protein
MLSDPATCSGPTGPFAHVYVTITDVNANISSTAGDSDSGWTEAPSTGYIGLAKTLTSRSLGATMCTLS